MTDSQINFRDAKPSNMIDLGSDHRTVQICIKIPSTRNPKQTQHERRLTQKLVDWTNYSIKIAGAVQHMQVENIQDIETNMKRIAKSCTHTRPYYDRENEDLHLEKLRKLRRTTLDSIERRNLSKEIWRLSRKRY